MALAFRPLLSETSMKSRWGAQALALGLRLGSAGAPESGVTSLAGFETAGGWEVSGSGVETGSESGVTSLAGFAGGRRPQAPGGRTPMPAAFK
jgi:hypothetical protein